MYIYKFTKVINYKSYKLFFIIVFAEEATAFN